MIVSSVVLAYHGCDRTLAEKVISGKTDLKVSKNDYDWLGEGAYFWENSPRRALRWAEYLRDNPKLTKSKIKNPAVVGAVIELGNCLDLTDQASLDLIKRVASLYKEFNEQTRLNMPENKQANSGDHNLLLRYLDCAVINFCHTLREDEEDLVPFDTVRGVFPEGGPLFKGSEISEKTHIQIAVRNTENILGYFWPRNAES